MTNVKSQPENKTESNSLTIRQGTEADSYSVFKVFEESLADLNRRFGSTTPTSWREPAALARMWEQRRSLYKHLAYSAEHFWVAEENGEIIGFARSILRDGLRQLTEIFVVPGVQSSGVGHELMVRSFPSEGARCRSIIATTDLRAQALYLKAGVYPRFPIYYFGRTPELVVVETDLTFKSISPSPQSFEALGTIDKVVVGHRRDVDHTWLLSNRQGYIYRRGDQPVGYGYLGASNGPFALLDAADFPAVLAHAESEAARNGREFGIEVPTINQKAVDYLLGRGYRLDSFVAIMMTDKPFGKFENYIFTSPPFFM